MAAKASAKNITSADAYAPPVPATVAAVRNPLEPLTAYPDGTLVLPRQLTHDNIAREVKLINLAKELSSDFEGVETEGNWGRRETNMIILRKITNSEIPKERTAIYVAMFRSLIDGIIKSATSLRTSLSLQGTTLIQEAANAVGSGLDQAFDILYRPLEKQCLTKPAQAQAANSAMNALIIHLSFHGRIVESISSAMDSKNKALRGYVIGWLDTLIQHCSKGTLESHVDNLEKILRKGLSDADGIVRDKSRGVFWTFSGKFKTRADIMYESLPKQSQKSLDAVLNQGTLSSKTYDSSLNRGPLPPRPATSHADRASLKQFIKDKKKEAKKTEILYPERPKSAAQGHERTNHDISGSVHSLKRSARAPDISFARPDSASSLTTVERRHAQQSSQDLKKAPRKQIDLTLEDPPISADVTRPAAMTPHAQRKAVRRPLERPESAVERPKSSGSGTATAPSRSVRPTNKPAVPTRPKTVASVSSSSTGTLSSAPKRPNFNRKALTTASTSSMHQIIDIPTDFTAETSNQTIPTHIAHIVTPPRLIQDLPLQVIQNPPDNITNRQPHSHAKDDPKPTPKDLPEFTHNKAIDARSINSGTLNVMASLLSDTSNQVPKDAFEILSIALDKGDSAVRRAGMDLGLALWGRVDDPIMFWSQLEGLREGTKNFLSYWINKG